jgi:hypothetical protein
LSWTVLTWPGQRMPPAYFFVARPRKADDEFDGR